LTASRSSRVFSETKSWICRRISSFGRRSSATRLISSMSMRWMRSRASRTRLAFCGPASAFGAGLRELGMTTLCSLGDGGGDASSPMSKRLCRAEKRLVMRASA